MCNFWLASFQKPQSPSASRLLVATEKLQCFAWYTQAVGCSLCTAAPTACVAASCSQATINYQQSATNLALPKMDYSVTCTLLHLSYIMGSPECASLLRGTGDAVSGQNAHLAMRDHQNILAICSIRSKLHVVQHFLLLVLYGGTLCDVRKSFKETQKM